MKGKYLTIFITIIAILYLGSSQYHKYNQILENKNPKALLEQQKSKKQYKELLEKSSNKKETCEDTAQIQNLKLYAKAALLMDAKSNRVLYEKNGEDEMPMASTTKIMTCIVTLENANLDDIVTVSSYAAAQPDVQLNMKNGDSFKLGDLLYSLMLESHNDTAVAIAEHVGGSVEGFAKLMNKKAKELGCEHTHFVTPNGLDATEHYTTAHDLAKIASYAIQNKTFLKITNTASWTFHELSDNREYQVNNKDRFLNMMDGAIGVKTGFTSKAGYCFVGALQRDCRTFVSVVLASGWPPNKTYKWADTTKLMDYGLTNYTYKDIFDHTASFEPLIVMNGQELVTSLAIDGEVSLLLSENDQVTIDYDIPDYVNAPIEAGDTVGYAIYKVNGEKLAKIPIYTVRAVRAKDYRYCLEEIINLFMTAH